MVLRRASSVFYRLKNLVPGDLIEVRRGDGSVVSYHVYWVQVAPKSAFPWRTVLGPERAPALRLVTCGGTATPHGHFLDNVIVYAR